MQNQKDRLPLIIFLVLIGLVGYLGWRIYSQTRGVVKLPEETEKPKEIRKEEIKKAIPPIEILEPKEILRPEKPEVRELPTAVLAEYQLKPEAPIIVDIYELEIKLVETGFEQDRKYADIEINYSKRESFGGKRHKVGETGWRPNPVLYPELGLPHELLALAKRVYRTHRYCTDEIDDRHWPEGREIIELEGYTNYVCRSRKHEQCILDGSFDTYYDERCDYGKIRFYEKDLKWSSNFGIEVTEISDDAVQIRVHSRALRPE